MTKSFVQETNFAHKDIHQEAECVTPTVTLPQSHRESLGWMDMEYGPYVCHTTSDSHCAWPFLKFSAKEM